MLSLSSSITTTTVKDTSSLILYEEVMFLPLDEEWVLVSSQLFHSSLAQPLSYLGWWQDCLEEQLSCYWNLCLLTFSNFWHDTWSYETWYCVTMKKAGNLSHWRWSPDFALCEAIEKSFFFFFFWFKSLLVNLSFAHSYICLPETTATYKVSRSYA